MAFDYGERRIGVAVSDPSGIIAQPLPTLTRRQGRRPPFRAIEKIIQEWDVQRIVVGLPLESSGVDGPVTPLARDFGEALQRRSGLPVDYWDERFTSVRAQREIAALELPAKARREKERVDAMAATLLLQAYLDAHAQGR